VVAKEDAVRAAKAVGGYAVSSSIEELRLAALEGGDDSLEIEM
jgi:hypothetical protein